jgi:DNA polymerase
VPIYSIDFETRSTVDLKTAGVHVYAQHSSTRVLCMAWRKDDEPVQIWRSGVLCVPEVADPFPQELIDHVKAGGRIMAHNAAFERQIWTHVLRKQVTGLPDIETRQWYCTMAAALACSLPGKLEQLPLCLDVSVRKDTAGHAVMLKLCKPRSKPGEPVVWWDTPELAEILYRYCVIDVETERAISKKLPIVSKEEQQLWVLDQLINDRGVFIDKERCQRALPILAAAKLRADARMAQITNGQVRTTQSHAAMATWVRSFDIECESVDKDHIHDLIEEAYDRDLLHVAEALELKAIAAKASVAKYRAFLAGVSLDGRARGTLQYHGAQTGRWSSKRLQLQNVVGIDWEEEAFLVDTAVMILSLEMPPQEAIDYLDLLTGESAFVAFSKSLRPMITAGPKKKLVGADYSNIEGRIAAWLGNEAWKIDAFKAYDRKEGPDLYKVAYARSFGADVNTVTKPERANGKVLELSCGFAGGKNAILKTAKKESIKKKQKMTMTADQAEELKKAWREAHPGLVGAWKDLEQAAIKAVKYPGKETSACQGRIRYVVQNGWLVTILPSGRKLHYRKPCIKMKPVPWNENDLRPTVYCWSWNNLAKKGEPKWQQYPLWQGLCIQNPVQAIAACLLRYAMQKAEEAGMPVVLTVHDELVTEVDEDSELGEADLKKIMEDTPSWARGLPIAAEPWEGFRYGK